MTQSCGVNRVLPLLLALFVAVPLRAAAPDVRFSQVLSREDRAAAGLGSLSSDEVAVIDALVRRDTARVGAAKPDEVTAPQFSARLTADERRTAGLEKLKGAEIAKLDELIERQQSAKLARTLLAPPAYLSRTSRVTPTEKKKEREIHGSFSLSYGFGSGGYSEKTGSMVLTMEDPDRGYSISIGYSESHIKGGSVYRPIYEDPFYSPGTPIGTVRP